MKIEKTINIIKEIYDLPIIRHREMVNLEFFNHIRKKHNFIIIALFDFRNRLFILRDFGKNYGWELLGGSVGENLISDYNDAIQKIAKKIIGTKVFNIQPIAFVKNQFDYEKLSITHVGMVFIARPLNKLNINANIKWGFMKTLPSKMFMTNLKIAELSFKVVQQITNFSLRKEAVSSENLFLRRVLHKKVINPLFDKFSSDKIKKNIFENLTNKCKTFLDVSSGDDDLIINIVNKFNPNLIVCNDISPACLDFLKGKINNAKLSEKMIFTNHNILELPFKYKFDVVICKNTFHHFKNDEEILRALNIFKNLGKKILIVDIEDPMRSTFLAKLWNKYYVYFLKDQGGYFLNRKKMRKLLSKCFLKEEFSIKSIVTVKGNYFISIINPL